tara:strand:+ start:673 stop:2184 length:1512 start_codon:yes stop_codon:yes gene_type:complete
MSRILGFIRDMFIASYLGSTFIADAFFVAFRIPNYFRRIFAEGAFSAAFIPIYSGIINNPKNQKENINFIENTMSLLFFSLIVILIIFHFFMPYIIFFLAPGLIGNQDAYELATHFGKIIFPYLLFIALVAQFSSITNAYNKFAFGAFAPSLLNISLIGSLLFFSPYLSTPGHSLSYGVILGGIFQFILMYYALTKLNIRPFFVLPKINDNIKKFLKLFFPGILSSGAIQLNIIVGTIIASFLPTGAISHLYYADRLTQLPLGVFGIALGIALLPKLSTYIKTNANPEKIFNLQNRSIEFSIFISIPAVIGLVILSEPIISILFQRGAFTAMDTYYTSLILIYFSLGLPAYILIKVLNPIFFSREDTKTPLYITLVSVLINIILSIIFIKYFREIGIAIATAISSWFNVIILYFVLKMRNQIIMDHKCKTNIFKIIIASILMLIALLFLKKIFFLQLMNGPISIRALLLLLNIGVSVTFFMILAFILKIYSTENIKSILRKQE